MSDLYAQLGEVTKRVHDLEEALENQEHTIREQEKDIVTLKLQVQALQDLKGTLEAYKTALRHIADGHPKPAGFAQALLSIG